MKLWVKIVIALILGVVTGLSLGPTAEILKPIGTVFLGLINMIVVPLVLASMTVGITSIHDPAKLSRIGLKTIGLCLLTTIISIAIGLLFAKTFQVGSNLHLVATAEVKIVETPSLGEIFMSLIPTNPIASLAKGDVLQIIVFSLFLGLSINFAGEKGKPVRLFLESLADVMYRMTSIIMEFSPLGVFAIMAWVSGSFGTAILLPLLKFLSVYYLACIAHVVLVICGMLVFWARLHPLPFFKGIRDAILMGVSTASSSATLPVSMHCTEKNLGVSKNITNFMLPLGSTLNMNGAAIFQGMAALFVAHAYSIHLDWQSILTIVVTATLSAIGAAGVPGTGFIMLTVVFASVGLPLEGLALLAGIDRIREMGSTALNVMGDTVCAVLVAKQEGELDLQQYYHEELVAIEE